MDELLSFKPSDNSESASRDDGEALNDERAGMNKDGEPLPEFRMVKTRAQELKDACIEVENCIYRLNTIAAKVRRQGWKYREAQARAFKDIVRLDASRNHENTEPENIERHKDTTFNRSEEFTRMITARINYTFPEAEEWLRERISKAISLRRNYLAFLDHISRIGGKVGFEDEDDDCDVNSSGGSSTTDLQSEPERPDSAPLPLDIEADEMSIVARTEASTLSFQFGQGINIPEPKEMDQNFFLCPYCRVICDAEDGVGKRWR